MEMMKRKKKKKKSGKKIACGRKTDEEKELKNRYEQVRGKKTRRKALEERRKGKDCSQAGKLVNMSERKDAEKQEEMITERCEKRMKKEGKKIVSRKEAGEKKGEERRKKKVKNYD